MPRLPHVGDPGVLGWVTVAAYGVTATLCAFAAVRAPLRFDRVFCAVLTLLLLALMVNKQLDFQTALTDLARCVAKAQGWSAYRVALKLWFVIFLGFGLLIVLVAAFRAVRGQVARLWPGCLGIICLSGFVLLRAAETHAFGTGLNAWLFGSGLNVVLELCGIALLAIQAIRLLKARSTLPIA